MFAHVHLAVVIVLAAWALGRLLGASTFVGAWFGVAGTAAVCFTREMTQREYQWIAAYGGGLRRNMPWYAGYQVWEWNRHSVEETLVAVAAAVVLALAIIRLGRG